MSPDPSDLEARITELAERLSGVEGRLSALERARDHRPEVPAGAVRTVEAVDDAAAEIVASRPKTEIISRVGRTLVVLAGAFLLRATTESGTIPQSLGTALGFGYALVWLAFAARAARAGRRTSATFHGLASALIAFPLVFEATVRFGFLSPAQSAAMLSVVMALGLGISAWLGLRRLAWVMTVGAAGTALALAVATKMLMLFVTFLLALGFVSLWVGYTRGWRGPAWLVAAIVDGSVLLMTLMVFKVDATEVTPLVQPGALLVLQLALVVIYWGSFGVRAVTRNEYVSGAEMTQAVAALVAGLGGAGAVTLRGDVSSIWLGVVGLILGAGCYAASFASIDRRAQARRNFIFFTTLALAATLVGFVALLGGAPLALALSATAVGSAWLGGVRSRATLSLHGAVYAVAAGFASGLFALAIDAFTGSAVPRMASVTLSALAALAAAAICCGFPVAEHGRTWGRFSRAPKAIMLTVLAIGLGGLLVIVLAALVPKATPPDLDPAIVAVLRTGVLAAAAVLLAAVGMWRHFVEATWLVYPVLIVGGLKLLVEDVPGGRASTLFVSLAFYGVALILAPRLVRRSAAAEESKERGSAN